MPSGVSCEHLRRASASISTNMVGGARMRLVSSVAIKHDRHSIQYFWDGQYFYLHVIILWKYRSLWLLCGILMPMHAAWRIAGWRAREMHLLFVPIQSKYLRVFLNKKSGCCSLVIHTPVESLWTRDNPAQISSCLIPQKVLMLLLRDRPMEILWVSSGRGNKQALNQRINVQVMLKWIAKPIDYVSILLIVVKTQIMNVYVCQDSCHAIGGWIHLLLQIGVCESSVGLSHKSSARY